MRQTIYLKMLLVFHIALCIISPLVSRIKKNTDWPTNQDHSLWLVNRFSHRHHGIASGWQTTNLTTGTAVFSMFSKVWKWSQKTFSVTSAACFSDYIKILSGEKIQWKFKQPRSKTDSSSFNCLLHFYVVLLHCFVQFYSSIFFPSMWLLWTPCHDE